ncbi:MAG: Ig-like domain-containing protein [Acidobacteriota bacterium]
MRSLVLFVAIFASSLLVLTPAAWATPTAADDLGFAAQGAQIVVDVLANDTPSPGGLLAFAELVAGPRNGTLPNGLDPLGQLVYQPDPGFEGVDVVAYRLSQDGRRSNVATVFLWVGDVQLLSREDRNLAMAFAGAANRTPALLEARADVAGQGFTPMASSASGLFNLRTFNNLTTVHVLETWDPGSAGTDATLYRRNDKPWQRFDLDFRGDGGLHIISDYTGWLVGVDGALAGGAVGADPADGGDGQIWLAAGPGQAPPPLASDDAYATPQDTLLAGNVLGNDQATGFDIASFLVAAPENGELVGIGGLIYDGITPWGTFDYQPDPGFEGVDTFSYIALSSANGAPSRVATVIVTVGANRPVAVDDVFGNAVDTVISANVLDNDFQAVPGFFDPQAVLVFGPRNGSFTGIGQLIYDGITPWGTFDYQPDPGFEGVDSFGYRVWNSGEASEVATVFLSVGRSRIVVVDDTSLALGPAGIANRTPVALTGSGSGAARWELKTSAADPRHLNLSSRAADPVSIYLETWDPQAAGTLATVYAPNDLPWQRFEMVPVGDSSFRIESRYTGLHLQLDGAPAFGTTLGAVPPVPAGAGQRWLLAGATQTLPPLTGEDTFTTTAGTVVSGNVLGNDQSNSADIASFPGTPPQNGQLVGLGGAIYGGVTPFGTFDYQPDPGFVGVDSFTYYALGSASGAPSRLVTVTIRVEPAP